VAEQYGSTMTDDAERLWVSTMPSLHRLRSQPRLVDRTKWLEGAVASKRLIHLGFLDVDRMEDKVASQTWLHERLARRADHAIGIDLDRAGIDAAVKAGYEAYACDLEDETAVASLRLAPAELVVAGELIEHLDCPGRFLDAVKPLIAHDGRLVLTTPNATSLTNVLVGLSRREWSSPHHVALYSWRTIATLLERHDWHLHDLLFYYRGKRAGPEAGSRPALALAFNSYERAVRPLLRFFPTIADGLIVVAGRAQG
jgi:SAM-dependent methyltransferase